MSDEARRTRFPPPPSIDRAAQTLVILAAFTLVMGGVKLATRTGQIEAARADDPTLTAGEVSRAVDLGVTIAVVLAVLAAVGYVVCARQIRMARRPARVAATVLSAVMTVLTASQLVAGRSGGFGALVVGLSITLGVALLIWLWSRPANTFFSATR